MGPAIARRYDLASFYGKKCRDIRDSQDPNGLIYTVAPQLSPFSRRLQVYAGVGRSRRCLALAGIPLVRRPTKLGRELCRYEGVCGLYAPERPRSDSRGAGLGDWYDYGHGESMGPSRFTPVDLTALATFYRCTQIVLRAAVVLGHAEDQRKYQALAQGIRQKIQCALFQWERCVPASGQPANGQCHGPGPGPGRSGT